MRIIGTPLLSVDVKKRKKGHGFAEEHVFFLPEEGTESRVSRYTSRGGKKVQSRTLLSRRRGGGRVRRGRAAAPEAPCPARQWRKKIRGLADHPLSPPGRKKRRGKGRNDRTETSVLTLLGKGGKVDLSGKEKGVEGPTLGARISTGKRGELQRRGRGDGRHGNPARSARYQEKRKLKQERWISPWKRVSTQTEGRTNLGEKGFSQFKKEELTKVLVKESLCCAAKGEGTHRREREKKSAAGEQRGGAGPKEKDQQKRHAESLKLVLGQPFEKKKGGRPTAREEKRGKSFDVQRMKKKKED